MSKIKSLIFKNQQRFLKHNFKTVQIFFQIELERLNTATDDINKLEVDLDVST